MKKFFLFLVCGLLFLNGYSQYGLAEPESDGAEVPAPCFMQKLAPDGERGFVLKGEIANSKDGMKVWLLNDMVWPAQKGDSSVIKNGKFELSGYISKPLLVKVIIDSQDGKEEGLLGTAFYLENSDITYTGDVNTLESYYYNPDAKGKVKAVVSGSEEDRLYRQFQKEWAPVYARHQALNEKYGEIYFSDDYQTNKAKQQAILPLTRQIMENDKAMKNIRLKYIKQYPKTGVAKEQLVWLIYQTQYIDFTAKQLEQVQKLMTDANPEEAAEYTKRFAQAKKTALGEQFIDLELQTPDGKKAKISDFVGKGKYVLLDFWFSGCGPCRAEIPHVKQVYEKYKNKDFTILSIAAEPKMADWLKALGEENMAWPQLYDGQSPEVYDGPVCTTYNVGGFPTMILLDKEGRFFKNDVRGANLDITLQELFGE